MMTITTEEIINSKFAEEYQEIQEYTSMRDCDTEEEYLALLEKELEPWRKKHNKTYIDVDELMSKLMKIRDLKHKSVSNVPGDCLVHVWRSELVDFLREL